MKWALGIAAFLLAGPANVQPIDCPTDIQLPQVWGDDQFAVQFDATRFRFPAENSARTHFRVLQPVAVVIGDARTCYNATAVEFSPQC